MARKRDASPAAKAKEKAKAKVEQGGGALLDGATVA